MTLGAMISFILFIASLPMEARLDLPPLARQAEALRMSNDQYIIQSDINSPTVKTGQSSVTITSSLADNGPVAPFTFSISNTKINFGSLIPGEPVTRNNILTISRSSVLGYQITVQENHHLRINGGQAVIPDTTCDAGNCSHTQSGNWTSPLAYGYGYRCDNESEKDCAKSFNTKDVYKQFASVEANKASQIIMSAAKMGKDSRAKITYKVNISANQAPGLYQNIIEYIATPSI